MGSYYFPILFLVPGFDGDFISADRVRIAKRKWETSIFDFATLATRHKLHLPYQAMDVFLAHCNLELCLSNCESLKNALQVFYALRVALNASGVSPFLSPFVTTHSINEYSGINRRDSDSLRKEMLPGMVEGLRSEDDTLEAWPLELSFQCILLTDKLSVSESTLCSAAAKTANWSDLVTRCASLKVLQDVTNSAPTIGNLDQSVLHLWSGLESLFPDVGAELSFRIALYVAQLCEKSEVRLDTYKRVRDSYGLRSRITHGTTRSISLAQWEETWSLLLNVYNAVIERGMMPSENDLLRELFS